MIEISHQQARRLIRQNHDSRLPNGQWATLQAHLESCPTCQTYQMEWAVLERDLRRSLRARWEVINATNSPITTLIKKRSVLRRKRGDRLRAFLVSGLGIFLVGWLVISGWHTWQANRVSPLRQNALLPMSATPTQEPTIFPTPTPLDPEVQGSAIFEAAGDGGQADLYLASIAPAGVTVENLTRSPSSDTDPAWSADGNWITFLSDRDSPNHAEIYALSVAGTRLTRLTNDPSITWSGPLSWSADGQWIAAIGQKFEGTAARIETHQNYGSDPAASPWIYLVSVNNADRPPLPIALEGQSPSFSPTYNWLAFVDPQNRLQVLDLYSRRRVILNEPQETPPIFDWSNNGSALVYVITEPRGASGAAKNVVHVSVGLVEAFSTAVQAGFNESFASDLSSSFTITTLPTQVTFGRDGTVLLVNNIRTTTEDCASYQMTIQRTGVLRTTLLLDGLCVLDAPQHDRWLMGLPASGLLPGQKQPSGDWLLTRAKTRGETQPALYALQVSKAGTGSSSIASVRLADLPANTRALRVRPTPSDLNTGAWLAQAIQPQSAAAARSIPMPNAEILQRALVVRDENGSAGAAQWNISGDGVPRADASHPSIWSIARLTSTPAGAIEIKSLPGGQSAFCPRTSPNGTQIAFLAYHDNQSAGWESVFVMDADGLHTRQLSDYSQLPSEGFWGSARIVGGIAGCPVWSPDGRQVAIWVRTDKVTYLAVFPVIEGDQSPTFFQMKDASTHIPPHWSWDSQSLFILQSGTNAAGDAQPTIMRVGLNGKEDLLVASDGWNTLDDLLLSPDGHWLVYLARTFSSYAMQVQIRYLNLMGSSQTPPAFSLPEYSIQPLQSYGSLAWLDAYTPSQFDAPSQYAPDFPGKLGIFFRGDGVQANSALFVYTPFTSLLTRLTRPGDTPNAVGWSPDGKWAMYSNDAGLWVLNISGSLQGDTAPAWLTFAGAQEITWK